MVGGPGVTGARAFGLLATPAFNEAARIGPVLDAIRGSGLSEDVVVIDDGSTDSTSVEAERRGVRVIRHPVNRGYHEALRTALSTADSECYPYLILFDADGQHDARDVPRLRERAAAPDRPDIVIGSRFAGASAYRTTFARRFGMITFETLTRVVGVHTKDTTSGFKLLDARVVRVLVDAPFNHLHAELMVLAAAEHFRVAEVPVEMGPSTGTSMYGWRDAVAYPLHTAMACTRVARWARARTREVARSS
jgi:glycosyltransferase involved in cell wall biosynthesis